MAEFKTKTTGKHSSTASSPKYLNAKGDTCLVDGTLYYDNCSSLPLDKKYRVQGKGELKNLAHAMASQRNKLPISLVRLTESEILKKLEEKFDRTPLSKDKRTRIIDVTKFQSQAPSDSPGPVANTKKSTLSIKTDQDSPKVATERLTAKESEPKVEPIVSKPQAPPRYQPVDDRGILQRWMVKAQSAWGDLSETFYTNRIPGQWSDNGAVYTAAKGDYLWSVLREARNKSTDPEIKNAPMEVLVSIANNFRTERPIFRLAGNPNPDGSKGESRVMDIRAFDGSLLPLQIGEAIRVKDILDPIKIRAATKDLEVEPDLKELKEISNSVKIVSTPKTATLTVEPTERYQSPYRFSALGIKTLLNNSQTVLRREAGMGDLPDTLTTIALSRGESSHKFLAYGGAKEVGLFQLLPKTAKSVVPRKFPAEIIRLAKEYEQDVPEEKRVNLDALLSEPGKGKSHYSPNLFYNPVINAYLGQKYFAKMITSAKEDIASGKIVYKSITNLPPEIELGARYFNGGRHGVRDWQSLGERGILIQKNTTQYVKHLAENLETTKQELQGTTENLVASNKR